MTLEDTITYYSEMAKACRRKARIESNDYMDMKNNAYEAEQLASWLNELKILKEKVDELLEIIHCRDCKYWREHKYAKETKRYIPFCGFNAIYTKADDFCSRAERREDGQT